MVAKGAVPLPYEYAPTEAVDWTAQPGWTGDATQSSAGGDALFDEAGRILTLEMEGAPTSLSFSLRGYSNTVGTAPASFIVEQSGNGEIWNSTLVADISEESLSAAVMLFGPYALQESTRYVRFTYADRYAFDVGLNNVRVNGGPAEPRVVFTDREDGFIVAQGAENEIITAAVMNGGGYWFGSPALEKEPWESDNGGACKAESPRDVYYIQTAVTGTFHATANGRGDNFDEVVAGTIHFTVAPAHALDLQVGSHGTASVQVNGREATQAPEGARVTVLPVPDEGHATDEVRLNGEAIEGATFTMPGEAVMVAVTFREKVAGEPTLILSQYYEGSGDNKWIELYNPGTEAVRLEAAGYRLGLWQNANREGWKAGTAPATVTVLTGVVASGSTYLAAHAAAAAPVYATAQVATNALLFNGDDSVVLYTGAEYAPANVVDAFGLTSNAAANCSYVRRPSVVCGASADVGSNEWVRVAYTEVDAAELNVPERLGWHATGEEAPPAPPMLSNLSIAGGGLVFEIPTNITDYTVHGAAGLGEGPASGWAGSSIVDQCTTELAENHTRITVPMTLGSRQIIWLSVPAAD